jgi:hypothetical protein
MSLNIKSEAVHKTAAELARRLDVSMTAAVTMALEDKLAATKATAEAERRRRRLLDGERDRGAADTGAEHHAAGGRALRSRRDDAFEP